MKLKSVLIFSGLSFALLALSSGVFARERNSGRDTGRYAGTSSYSSQVITQNQNYVATTGTATGGGSNPLGGSGCGDEGICVQCKRLVSQALKSYCRGNECSEASNAFIIAKALPLSSTLVNIDQTLYDSPSTAVSSGILTQGQGYNQTLVQSCQPYLVKNVEELLPAYYDIVTDECKTQYQTAIDHYMANNDGGFKVGPTGEKGIIRNFELLEYFKTHSTPVYADSLYQNETSENYYFSAYCMAQMADSVKTALIDLYLPDMFTYQRNLCKRSYEMAMQQYCNAGNGQGCRGEIDYMTLLMNQAFISQIRSDNVQINCATELSQDVREALVEEVTRKQNICAREMGLYSAENDMCQFSVSLVDAKNKEIDRKQYFEGETVQCNEKDFIDPYSKEGRKRADKGWLASERGAKIVYGSGGTILGALIGGSVGKNVARKEQINDALESAGVPEEEWDFLRDKVTGLSGNYNTAVGELARDLKDNKDKAEKIIKGLYDIENDTDAKGEKTSEDKWTLGALKVDTKTGKQVGTVVGGVAGGVGAVAGTNFVYNKLYDETKCYKTWRLATETLDDSVNLGELEDTDRPVAEWGKSKALPTLLKGKNVEIDSLPTYDREYSGDPKWEDK